MGQPRCWLYTTVAQDEQKRWSPQDTRAMRVSRGYSWLANVYMDKSATFRNSDIVASTVLHDAFFIAINNELHCT